MMHQRRGFHSSKHLAMILINMLLQREREREREENFIFVTQTQVEKQKESERTRERGKIHYAEWEIEDNMQSANRNATFFFISSHRLYHRKVGAIANWS